VKIKDVNCIRSEIWESYLLDSERSKVIREMNETYTEFNYKETKKEFRRTC